MREGKLYQAIIHLNGHELNRLHRFILSPFFNRNESIINLFDWVKNDLKSKVLTPVSKEELWSICFGPNEEFDDGRFRKLQSDLLKLIETYYAQESYEANPIHRAKYLMETINSKKLEPLQASAIKTAYQLVEEQSFLDASYYYYQYDIERNIYLLTRNQKERSSKSNLESIVTNLDRFYLAEKLRYSSFILTHQHFAAVNYKMLFTDEIIEHVRTHDYSDVPSILIYYQILLTYKEPENRKHYEILKEYLKKYIHLFPRAEGKEILDSVLNYCIIRMNAGEAIYVREVFNLYCQALETELILINGQITPWSFKNIVTAGLRLNEFDWVENFIHDHNKYLDVKFRENAITFNLAQLYFYKKEYKKVIEQLSKVEYEDFTYNLNSKTLLMASYYELDEFEALNSLLDTFRLYVQRNKKLTKGKGSHYLNTISIVRKLAKSSNADIKQIEKLTKEVNETQGIVSKNWILEKLAALK
jgi:hypothetical protein